MDAKRGSAPVAGRSTEGEFRCLEEAVAPLISSLREIPPREGLQCRTYSPPPPSGRVETMMAPSTWRPDEMPGMMFAARVPSM